MGIYVKKIFLYFHIFSFFHDFIIYIDFTHIAASSTELMTSQIRSHIEYLTQTYNILLLILHSNLMKIIASSTVFNIIWRWWLIVAYFVWATLNNHKSIRWRHDAISWPSASSSAVSCQRSHAFTIFYRTSADPSVTDRLRHPRHFETLKSRTLKLPNSFITHSLIRYLSA